MVAHDFLDVFFWGFDHYNLDPNPAVSENGVNLNWPSNDRRNDHSLCLWESIRFFLFFSAAFSEKPSPPSPTTYPPSEVHQLAERPHIHLFAGQPHEVSLSEKPKVARIIGFTAGLSNKHRDLAWFNPEKWWYNMKLYDRMGYYDMMEVTWTNVETSCLMKIGWFPIIPYRPQNATLVRLIGNGRITV